VEDCGQVEAGDAAVDLLRAADCGRGNTSPTRGLGSSSRDIAPSVSSRQRAPRLGGLLNIARQGVQAVREDTTCLDWPDLGVTSGIADPLCLLVGKVLHAKLQFALAPNEVWVKTLLGCSSRPATMMPMVPYPPWRHH
jgi:hypothetical protein